MAGDAGGSRDGVMRALACFHDKIFMPPGAQRHRVTGNNPNANGPPASHTPVFATPEAIAMIGIHDVMYPFDGGFERMAVIHGNSATTVDHVDIC